ncbi:MAG: helix-turn-helix domain-containing protein [Coriobacteriia bacterium]|nr:helix-turn-helix domain-containing protein [Coriobacteriia bacterium]
MLVGMPAHGTVPCVFDRQQLADYLGVDRSALSAELSRMQKAGLIETRRSHFILK